MEKLKYILFIDLNISSVFLSYRLLKKMGAADIIHIENSSIRALQFLQYYASSHQSHSPELIIVNLDLPSPNGMDFLNIYREMKFSNAKPVNILATMEKGGRENAITEDEGYLVTYLNKKHLDKKLITLFKGEQAVKYDANVCDGDLV